MYQIFKVSHNTSDLVRSSHEVPPLTKVSKMINLQYPKNGSLDCHIFCLQIYLLKLWPNCCLASNCVQKNGDRQCIKNYYPVSLLPVCSKVFEWLLYNSSFSFFSENYLILPKKCEFRPGDSCADQLLSIAHEIVSAFDDGHEVRGVVFLDIPKAFYRVWHKGLLFKLQQNGISGELITLIKDFLSCRKQRVVLNGQHLS